MTAQNPDSPIPAAELAERLRRWEESGATWHVLTRSVHTVTVSLCRCDDGEEVERLRSDDPAALTLLRGRSNSEDQLPGSS
ncbi:hypothetical protein [Microlunatus speluncae]|uniref:hypothetical protein n=1 Tax=Microlunatus speluncae TaxID=2594267 RepID=UPI0012660F42|nr:hypothetical protein [Microlunatus speluncae]